LSKILPKPEYFYLGKVIQSVRNPHLLKHWIWHLGNKMQ